MGRGTSLGRAFLGEGYALGNQPHDARHPLHVNSDDQQTAQLHLTLFTFRREFGVNSNRPEMICLK